MDKENGYIPMLTMVGPATEGTEKAVPYKTILGDIKVCPMLIDKDKKPYFVKKDIGETLGIPFDDIYKTGLKNLKAIPPNVSFLMDDFILGHGYDMDGLVLTMPDGKNGAAYLETPEVFKDVSRQYGEASFFILPSSRDELLLMFTTRDKFSDKAMLAGLSEMIKEVNKDKDSIRPIQRLSDHPYAYDGVRKVLFNPMEKIRERPEKETDTDKEAEEEEER